MVCVGQEGCTKRGGRVAINKLCHDYRVCDMECLLLMSWELPVSLCGRSADCVSAHDTSGHQVSVTLPCHAPVTGHMLRLCLVAGPGSRHQPPVTSPRCEVSIPLVTVHCSPVSWLSPWSLVTVSLLRTTLGWTLINIPSASAVGASHQPLMPASHWSPEPLISLLIGWLCEAVCERLTRPQCRQRTTGPSPVPASVPAVASTSQTQNRIMPEPGTRYYWHLQEHLPAYLIIGNYSQYLADRSYYSFSVTEVLPWEPGGWWQGLGAVSAVCTPGHSLPDFCHKITGNERANTRHWPASEC